MHCDAFKQDNYSTVGGDGGCRVGEVRAGTTSPMPDCRGLNISLGVLFIFIAPLFGLKVPYGSNQYVNKHVNIWCAAHCIS